MDHPALEDQEGGSDESARFGGGGGRLSSGSWRSAQSNESSLAYCRLVSYHNVIFNLRVCFGYNKGLYQ